LKKIACVFLAAGRSERMGAPNKLLLPIQGEPLAARTLRKISAFPFCEIVCVTGFDAEKVRESFPAGTQIAYNKNYVTGMHSSIRVGLSALKSDFDGAMICLADLPELPEEILFTLAENFSENSILFPMFEGERGHPVLIAKEFVPEILVHEDGDYGCSYLIKNHPAHVFMMVTNLKGVTIDIDTADDYERALELT
jgi:molybdenum cofactor cytidylyltransferase